MIRELTVRTGMRGVLVLQVVATEPWKYRGSTVPGDTPSLNVVTRDATVNDLPELIERGFINRLGEQE